MTSTAACRFKAPVAPEQTAGRFGSRSRSRSRLVVFLLTLLLAAKAEAQSPDENVVQLSISDCEYAPAADVTKLIVLDLAARGLRVAESPRESASAQVRASLQCSPTYASIVIEDARRVAPLQLELSLIDTAPEARTRFLALAVTELIATSELEPTLNKPIVEPPARVEADRPPRAALWLAGGGALAYRPSLIAPELQLGAALGLKRFFVQLDADLSWGSRSVSQAQARARMLSFALAAGLRLHEGTLAWDVAAGVRAGVARLAGDATRADEVGRAVSGFVIAPLLQSALGLRVAADWRVQLAFELDYIAKPLRGLASDGTTLIALRGLRASLLLGVVLTLND